MNRFDPSGAYPSVVASEYGDSLLLRTTEATPEQIARACFNRFVLRRRRVPTEGELVAEAATLQPPYSLKLSTAGYHLRQIAKSVPNPLGTDF